MRAVLLFRSGDAESRACGVCFCLLFLCFFLVFFLCVFLCFFVFVFVFFVFGGFAFWCDVCSTSIGPSQAGVFISCFKQFSKKQMQVLVVCLGTSSTLVAL